MHNERIKTNAHPRQGGDWHKVQRGRSWCFIKFSSRNYVWEASLSCSPQLHVIQAWLGPEPPSSLGKVPATQPLLPTFSRGQRWCVCVRARVHVCT